MPGSGDNPFDKEPAEGSRDVVDRELKRQETSANHVDHLSGVDVSGQLQGGAVDRAREKTKNDKRDIRNSPMSGSRDESSDVAGTRRVVVGGAVVAAVLLIAFVAWPLLTKNPLGTPPGGANPATQSDTIAAGARPR